MIKNGYFEGTVHGEADIVHAAMKHSRGDTVRVALSRKRINIETDARNIAIGAI